MNNENNKMQVDIENLFKQNVNDLTAIKILFRKLKETEDKISQIKFIDSTLANKLKKEYEKLKKIIMDENAQAYLANEIETLNENLSNEIETLNENLINEIERINENLSNDIESINSQLDTIILNTTDVVNIQKIGAKGDGITDDTYIINKALNEYKTIYFPKGEYLCKSRIIIEIGKEVNIIGAGKEIATFKFPHDYKDDIMFLVREANADIRNIGFYYESKDIDCGFKDTIEGTQGALFSCNGTSNLFIDNCKFSAIDGGSICNVNVVDIRNVRSDLKNITIQNCEIIDKTNAGRSGSLWLRTQDNPSTGYVMDNIKITNNYILKNKGAEAFAMWGVNPITNVIISNNTIFVPRSDVEAGDVFLSFFNDDMENIFDNVQFVNNTIDINRTFKTILRVTGNVVFKDNTVNMIADSDFNLFDNSLPSLIYGNKINIKSDKTLSMSLFNCPIGKIKNNVISLNGTGISHDLIRGKTYDNKFVFEGNEITTNSTKICNISLSNETLFKNNIFNSSGDVTFFTNIKNNVYIYGNKLNNVSLDVSNNGVNTNLVIKDNEIGSGINIRTSTKLNKLLINDNLIGNLTLDFEGATTSNITNYTNLYSVKNNFKLSDLSEYILV